MSTNSSRKINQNDNVESPTLLSKLDQLDAQMKLAFPSSTSKKVNDDSSTIKLSTGLFANPKSSTIKNDQPKSIINDQSVGCANLIENKENINEKSIKIDKQIKNSTELISPLKEKPSIEISNSKNINNNLINESSTELNQQSPTIVTTSIPSISNIITTVNTLTTTNTLTNTTTNKSLSAWKKTKILSKTLSSINVMKSRTAANASNNQTLNQQQNLKVKDDNENQLKKSSSGNLLESHNHLNSPLNQIKRRSQEEVSIGLNVNNARLSSSLSSSCQTSIHNLNETPKINSQTAIQAALNNLNQSTGTYHIPDNYNTTIINQLNKNYLKNIQKQKKVQSDWKSLTSKLIGLARKENEDNTDSGKLAENTETTANTTQRKLSNSNQTTADDGIICKKEDLLFLLRNSNLAKNKQRRSNKPSLADVVVQLQESKAKKVNTTLVNTNQLKDKNNLKQQNDSLNERSNQLNNEINNQSIHNYENNNSIKKGKQVASNGRVQFVLTNNESQNSGTPAPTKIKSSLKKTTSTTPTNLIDKNQNNLIRQTKSNTINNMNLNKKKVKIYETDQDGIRKAMLLQSIKDRNNNENSIDEENDRNQLKIKNENLVDEDESKEEQEHEKIKWDETNIVDASILGDAIAAFLSSITTNASTSNSNSSTYSGVNKPVVTEKKVSFKK